MISKIAFLGTPEVACSALQFLVDSGYEIPVVVTGADKKRGRGSGLSRSPVGVLAHELGLNVSHDPKVLLETDFDLALVVAYGRLISDELLGRGLFVNLHFSLLPRWRGAAPMERAILAGDKESGVCVMKLVKELDEGPLFQVRKIDIDDEVTLQDLSTRLATLANEALRDELSKGEEAFCCPKDQAGVPSYAHKLNSNDLRIDWNVPAIEVLRKVRIGRAWTTFSGARVKIVSAAISERDDIELAPGEIWSGFVGTSAGLLELKVVQPENRRAMDAKAWTNGLHSGVPRVFI